MSMTLIFSTLKFETKILDIGYLLLLKLLKEPKYEVDMSFAFLFTDLLAKQKRYNDALKFLDEKSHLFDLCKPLKL